MKKNNMVEVLNKYNDILECNYKFFVKGDKEIVLEEILIKDKKLLYNSEIHGLNHSEKVLLFIHIIQKEFNLSDIQKRILYDAAFYHDIGRETDQEDNFHGFSSARLVEQCINSEIYEDEINLKMLKAIIDMHSCADSRERFVFEYYELPEKEFENFKLLSSILKDADALDRTRFRSSSKGYLDERFLRYDISKEVIDFSSKINEYYNLENSKKVESDELLLKLKPMFCLHTVGHDIFKMISILKNGILSKNEMINRGITGTVNFNGGNVDDWISLVKIENENLSYKNSGYELFIKNGISFLCYIENLYKDLPLELKDIAIEKGMPYSHSEIDDEVYTKGCINIENILGLSISKNCSEITLDEIEYLYMTLSYDILSNRIKFLCQNLDIPVQIFEKELQFFKDLNFQYCSLLNKINFDIYDERKTKVIIDNCKSLIKTINNKITELIKQKYEKLIGIKNLKLIDIILYELKTNSFEYKVSNNLDCYYIEIANVLQVNKNKTSNYH